EMEVTARPTTGDAAPAAVAPAYESPHTRRDVLHRTLADRINPLGVALRALERSGVDRNAHAGALGKALAATGALDRQDLMPGLRRLARSTWVQDGIAQRGDERVVIEAHAGGLIEHLLDLAQPGECLGADLEPERSHHELGPRRIARAIAAPP